MKWIETEWGVGSYFENIFIEPAERPRTIQLKLLQQQFLLLNESSQKCLFFCINGTR